MPITIQCKCGKRLRAPDQYAGKRVKCPGCSKPISVPAREEEETGPILDYSAQESEKCPACGQAMVEGALVCTSCGFNKETGQQLKVRKKKSSKPARSEAASVPSSGAGIGASVAGLFDAIPIGKILIILGLGGVIWGGMTFWQGFSNPPPLAGYSMARVDAYAVAENLETMELAGQFGNLNKISGEMALGGDRMLIVTQDDLHGQFLHLSLRLAKRYFENQGKVRRDRMTIEIHDLKLVGADGMEHTGIFLIGQYDTQPLRINVQRFPKDATLPFQSASLNKWRHHGNETGDLEPQYLMDDIYKQEIFEGVAGTWSFEGERGMKLHLEGQQKMLHVSWDSPAVAWRAGRHRTESAVMFDTFGEWPIDMLFPRPSGDGPYHLVIGEHRIPVSTSGG